MKLRTRLNLVRDRATAMFVAVLLADRAARCALLGARGDRGRQPRRRPAPRAPGDHLSARRRSAASCTHFLTQLGHVRANEITLRGRAASCCTSSPPATYKAGREAPRGSRSCSRRTPARTAFRCPAARSSSIEAESSRAILDAWDDLTRLLAIGALMLVVVERPRLLAGRARAGAVSGDRRRAGAARARRAGLPPAAAARAEAHAIGAAFNRMAQAVRGQGAGRAQGARSATRLEERRELAQLIEQRLEEERRLIAHELHDEFGQSVTAIRSLALAIATQSSQPPDCSRGGAADLGRGGAALRRHARPDPAPGAAVARHAGTGASARESGARLAAAPSRRRACRCATSCPPISAPSVTLAAYRVVQEGLDQCAAPRAARSQVDVELRAERAQDRR